MESRCPSALERKTSRPTHIPNPLLYFCTFRATSDCYAVCLCRSEQDRLEKQQHPADRAHHRRRLPHGRGRQAGRHPATQRRAVPHREQRQHHEQRAGAGWDGVDNIYMFIV